MANIFETKLPQDQIWYFGNNRRKDLRLSQPKWNYPFFLTTSYEYARDYADYGVYKIILSNQEDLNILDFNNQQEVQQLHWPEIVVKTIQAGNNDLNSIAYDLYVLAYGEGKKQPIWIEDTEEWRLAAYYFRDKSLGVLDYAASGSVWGSEEDHAFLMQMWKDIHDAGFDGFIHVEFGQKVLALFDLRCIGKISANPVNKKQRGDQILAEKTSNISYYSMFMKEHPNDNLPKLLDSLVSQFASDMKLDNISVNGVLEQNIYSKNGNINELVLDKLSKKMKHRYRWEKISADVYAAIISRFVNVMKQTNNQQFIENDGQPLVSHMVSRRVLEECLNIICHNTNVLEANALLTTGRDVELVTPIFKKYGFAETKTMMGYVEDTCYTAMALYAVWAAFASGINTKYMCRSNSGPDKLKDILRSIPYDASDVDLIVALNRSLDVVHCLNDLSLAFIEGGKKTCSKVSQLKANEIYESLYENEDLSLQSMTFQLNEKNKFRKLKKTFKYKGKDAFPEIKSDDDIMFVRDIPKEKALHLLKRALHDVSNFHPEYMDKALRWSNDRIFGLFNKHDKRNVLALASVDYNNDTGGAAYLHEMTGFIKGGYGKKLVLLLMNEYKKIYGQIALEGDGTKSDPYRPNEDLRDKFYANIPGLKIYRCENSVWDCPADFFYYGISDDSMKEFIEEKYGKKNNSEELVESLGIHQTKKMQFPENEIQDLKSRNHIITHRVSRDFDRFDIGDVVKTPWDMTYKITQKMVVDDVDESPFAAQLSDQQKDFLNNFDKIAILTLDAIYDPPYTLDEIKANYPEKIFQELSRCPIHRWRAETGIELIHKEPDEEELDRIWRNWQLMPKELKDISDKKSLELFGCTNAENYKKLKSSTIDESKQTYLWKYRDEKDAEDVVKTFWSVRSRLQPPFNDIDWWIKKPFADLRNFVQTHDFSNKRSRRDAEWRSEALQNDAKMLGERDGYEIWYVPTYESMKILGRFYKGRSAKWCVASDDPDWWFDHHDEDEYVLLIRENPLGDEFDKVAIQMENKGRYFDEECIIPWDLENNDLTFDRGVVDDAPELMHYAWELFRENGELREHYY